MALQDEDLKFNIVINGNEGQKQIVDYTVKTKALRDEQRKLVEQGKKNSKEYKDLGQEIAKNEAHLTKLRKEVGLNALSMKDLVSEQRRLKAAMYNVSPQTKVWKQYNTELLKVNNRLRDLRATSTKTKFSIGKLADGMNRFQTMAIGAIAVVTGLVMSLSSLIDGNYELSDSFADVAKTTELTNNQVKVLYKDLKELDTRTSRKQLLELAETAGRLGIKGSANIKKFVNEADKIQVALGDVLGDTAIKDVGKLANLFDTSMTKIGNTINKLGASSQAQEGYIIDFMKRTAGAAANAGLTVDQLSGIGATLDSLGQTVETSGTAISKTIIDMFSNTEEYAKVAGLGIQEFTDLLNNDANEALIKVIEGLKGNNEGMSMMVERLNTLGVDGARTVSVLGALGNNTDMLREQQALANAEYKNGSSMLEEFNKKNTNFAANIDKIKKNIYGLFVNGSIMSGLERFALKFKEFTDPKISEQLSKDRIEFNAIADTLKRGNIPLDVRKELIDKLNANYEEYLPNLLSEHSTLVDINKAQYAVNQSLEKRINLEAKKELSKEAFSEVTDATKNYYDALLLVTKQEDEMGQGKAYVGTYQNLKNAAKEYELAVTTYEKTIKDLAEVEKQIYGEGGEDGNTDAIVGRLQALGDKAAQIKQEEENKLIQLQQRIIVLQNEFDQSQKTQFEKRKDEINQKYDLEVHAAKGYSVEIFEINKIREQELNALRIEFADKNINKREDLINKLKQLQFDYEQSQRESLDRQLVAIEAKYAKEIEDAKGNADIIGQLKELQANEQFDAVETWNAEDYQKRRDAEKEFLDRQHQLKKEYSLYSAEQLEQQEIDAAQKLYEEKLFSLEEFEIVKANIVDKYNELELEKDKAKHDEKLALYQSYASKANSITSALSSAVTSVMDAELAAAGTNEEEKIAIKKKYADIQFAADAASILSSTAVAVMQGYAELGPIGGSISAALLVVDGLAQLAISNEQREAVQQLAKGKYTVFGQDDGLAYSANYVDSLSTGLVSQPTLVGEEPEIVISTAATKNIMLNDRELIPRILGHEPRVPQRASGKYPEQSNSGNDSELKLMVSQQTKVMNALIKKLNEPLKADVSLYGSGGLYEAESTDAQINADINA